MTGRDVALARALDLSLLLIRLHRRQTVATGIESARPAIETLDAESERVLTLVLFLLHPAGLLGQQLAEREIIRSSR